MRRLRELDRELYVTSLWLLVAVFGFSLPSTPIGVFGVIGAAITGALYIWQRECLVGVTYRRKLNQSRALFGERVELEIEIVNDKLLPLSWLRVEDDIPPALAIEGGNVLSPGGLTDILVQLLPTLPYERVRRRVIVVCNHRGEYTFGPATVSSGDPVGLRERSIRLEDVQHLLVYPKVFALTPSGIASRVFLGEQRSRFDLLEDPSRIAGIREYRAGDPVRHIDWRATARRSTLLVREFEPSVSLNVAVFLDVQAARFVDVQVDGFLSGSHGRDKLEFTVALAASIISNLSHQQVPTGLFASGSVHQVPVAHPPSTSTAALATVLEALACVSPFGGVSFSNVLGMQAAMLGGGTTIVTIANDYPTSTLLALAELRRHHAVTAVWVESDFGSPPPAGLVDSQLSTRYSDDWRQQEELELTS
jgi:uncharacterized protein (DUF58 family)